MKEQEDRIMHVIREQRAFTQLLNDIISQKETRGSETVYVDTTKFECHIGVGEALIEVNDSGRNDIRIIGSTIEVTDLVIPGKIVTYHLKQSQVDTVIAEDIVKTVRRSSSIESL